MNGIGSYSPGEQKLGANAVFDQQGEALVFPFYLYEAKFGNLKSSGNIFLALFEVYFFFCEKNKNNANSDK